MLLLFVFKGLKRVEEAFSRERKSVDDLLDIAKVLSYEPLMMWCFTLRNCILVEHGVDLYRKNSHY